MRQSHLRNKRTDTYVPDDPANKDMLPYAHKNYAASFHEEEYKGSKRRDGEKMRSLRNYDGPHNKTELDEA